MSQVKVRFTRHAAEKFDVLERYGFRIRRKIVVQAVNDPAFVERRDNQVLALKVLDDVYALRVVYEERNDIKIVVTFYPVRRDRFGV